MADRVGTGDPGWCTHLLERVACCLAATSPLPYPDESWRWSRARRWTVADSSGRGVLYAYWQLRGVFYHRALSSGRQTTDTACAQDSTDRARWRRAKRSRW